MTPSPTMIGSKKVWLVVLLLMLSTLLYAPSLANDFTWDDKMSAMGQNGNLRHPLVAELRPLGEYLSNNWWPHSEAETEAYRPLATLTFALRHACCGDHAGVAHGLNILLHTLAVSLCLMLLRCLGASFGAAWLGSLVFAMHAIHSESVCSVVGRAELLALVMGLGATLLLARVLACAGTLWYAKRRLLHYAVVAFLLLLACTAKESGLAWVIVAPAIAALSQGLRVRRADVVAMLTVLVPLRQPT